MEPHSVVVIRADVAVIEKIAEIGDTPGIMISSPVSATNSGGTLDAPLNLQDKLARAALVTAIISAGSAGMALSEQILKTLENSSSGTTIVIEDRGGRVLGTIDKDMSKGQVYTLIVNAADDSPPQPGSK